MTTINQLYSRLISAMGVEDLEIPMTAVKFYKKEDEIPEYGQGQKISDRYWPSDLQPNWPVLKWRRRKNACWN